MIRVKKPYTKLDVNKLVATKRLDMSDLSARRLSSTQVMIEVENAAGVDVISAPSKFKNSKLVDVLLHSFTLPDYVIRVGISEKRRRSHAVISFFSFLEHIYEPKPTGVPSVLLDNAEVPAEAVRGWRQNLAASKSKGEAWRSLNALEKVLMRTMTRLYGRISNWPKQVRPIWVALKANLTAKPVHEKTLPLGMYLGIAPNKFHDEELYMGLRYGVIWLLLKLNAQREKILKSPVVSEMLRYGRGKSLEEFESHFFWLTGRKGREDSPVLLDALAEILRSIQHDELLTEWQCYSFRKLQPLLSPAGDTNRELLKAEAQTELLSRFLSGGKNFRIRPKGYGRNDLAWEPLRTILGAARSVSTMPRFCWWGSGLVRHTPLERILMVWLLATERAQSSGIKNLTLEALVFSGSPTRSLQISTLKLRRLRKSNSINNPTVVNTQVYKRTDPLFRIYRSWHSLEISARDYFKNYNNEGNFIYPASTQNLGMIAGREQQKFPDVYLPLTLMATSGTVWSQAFLNESKNCRESEAFVAIFKNRIEQQQALPGKQISLPPSVIGQSLIVKKELSNNTNDSMVEIESETMGHSVSTGRNVYKHGFSKRGVEDIIEPVRAFARRVGSEKIALAERIADELSSRTKKVSFSELEKICGVESAVNEQEGLLSLLDEQDKMTIAGEVIINGEVLIVESDFIAALMYAYIKNLESKIPELLSTDRGKTAMKYLSKYLYLNQVFNVLDPRIKKAGQLIAEQTEFPFPSLS